MTTLSPADGEERFREAIRTLNTGEYAADLALGSLLASVQGNQRYEYIAREETAPRSGEMDLHLEGVEVIGHSANAAAFGEFVKKMADSVKIITRERAGRKRMVSDLLVEPGPGSVRVIFRTPDPVPLGGLDEDDRQRVWSDPNSQSVALQQVAQLLASAEPGSPDETSVDGLVETLPPRARATLVAAVKSITSQDWQIRGEFRQRGLGIQPIKVSRAGAARLKIALQVREREHTPWTATGVLDGHRRARSLCWFIEDGTGREVTAVVPTPELMVEVATLSQDEAHRVIASFTVITTHGPGAGDAGSKSYILESVRAAPVDLKLGE
ncbi:hypothetical protein E3T39_06190 [Cryobacterium suzukii]|uniref:Uncharacterized protein n=1 Tax=Cryobacterium suzukii TaxID=1259198 RepID=A0A4R9AGP9_9MICO|nr:hypothetical protein [Cryobacterium suzukii]TFD61628.1 hypothetical protein E3T39_06190 [Cryobacterium suzukii]